MAAKTAKCLTSPYRCNEKTRFMLKTVLYLRHCQSTSHIFHSMPLDWLQRSLNVWLLIVPNKNTVFMQTNVISFLHCHNTSGIFHSRPFDWVQRRLNVWLLCTKRRQREHGIHVKERHNIFLLLYHEQLVSLSTSCVAVKTERCLAYL